MPSPWKAVLALLLAAPWTPPAAAEDEPTPREAPRRYVIERVDVVGLVKTREEEVRRRLLVSAGEVLDDERVLLSRLRLLQLGWFSGVTTRVERGSERGRVVLVFDLAERNTLLASDLVLGWTPPQGLYGGFGLAQQNFLGRGLGLSGAFVYGGSRLDRPQDPSLFGVRAGFFAPDVPAKRQRLVAGATALFLRGEELTCSDPECDAYAGDLGGAPRLRFERLGAEAVLGFRPGPFERLTGSIRLEAISAERVPGTGTDLGPAPFVLPGESLLTALTGTYEIDTRDDFFFPRAGVRATAQITFASRFLGGDYDYSRYLVQLESAFAIFKKRLRLQAAAGAVQGDAPFFDRFYAADFSYFSIGPALWRGMELNFSTDSRYDSAVAMAGLEYGLPLWSRGGFLRRGYLALGLRGVYTTAGPGAGRTRASSWPVSGEVALRLDTPVGFVNLSAGALLDFFL
ncbi:MAG TPA: BamA/TamA family outer membrane protein [Anaeromyxobacteraceae bacterium]|nr:BamA/TamA family outer membrane protein [Anaeromyxobacteraceae bacterium]